MLLEIIKLLLFMISSVGYWFIFKRRLSIASVYLPIYTAAVQVTILFVFALCGMLFFAAFALYIFGYIFLAISLKEGGFSTFKIIKGCEYLFLFLSLGLGAALLWGSFFSSLDDFTHWALTVKIMLKQNRLPGTVDQLMHYAAYPPGAALYVYYFVRFVGDGEYLQMIAQLYLLLCGMLPLFSFVRGEKKGLRLVWIFLLADYLLVSNVGIYGLKVDSLLAVCGAALLLHHADAFVLHKDISNKRALISLPYLVLVCLIKNPGLYFVLAAFVLSVPFLLKQKKYLACTLHLLCPVVVHMLWRFHYGRVYDEGVISEHAMNVENYMSVLSTKQGIDMAALLKNVLAHAFTGRSFGVLLIWLVLLLLFALGRKGKAAAAGVKFFAAMSALYLLYTLGVYVMYLVSMPPDSVDILAGFERYMQTIRQSLWMLSAAYYLYAEDKNIKTLAAAFGILLIARLWAAQDKTLLRNMPAGEEAFANREELRISVYPEINSPAERIKLERVITENKIEEGKSYLFCLPADDCYVRVHYFWFLAAYSLYSSHIELATMGEEPDWDFIQQYDYLIVRDRSNEALDAWVQTHNNACYIE